MSERKKLLELNAAKFGEIQRLHRLLNDAHDNKKACILDLYEIVTIINEPLNNMSHAEKLAKIHAIAIHRIEMGDK